MDTSLTQPVKSVLASYDSHEMAENAILRLQENGFDVTRFSIVAVDLYLSEKALGFYDASDRMKKWALSGGFFGRVFGDCCLDSLPTLSHSSGRYLYRVGLVRSSQRFLWRWWVQL